MGRLDEIAKMMVETPVEEKKPEPEPEPKKPVLTDDTCFTPEDRAIHVEGVLQRFKQKNLTPRRREKKMMRNFEYDATNSR